MKGIFYNSSKACCSIYEAGVMTYNALRGSKKYELDYTEKKEINYGYDFAVFNHHVTVNNWMTEEMIRKFNKPNFCVVTEVHHNKANSINGIPPFFKYYILLDPTISDDNRIFGFPRPLEKFDAIDQYENKKCPIVGSFGFATPGKEWVKIVREVQKEFDEAIIRINIPLATYVPMNVQNIPAIHNACESVITKSGIKLEFSSKFMEKKELIKWCSENTLNCFLYNRNHSHPTGLCAVTDQAISSQRPLLVSNDITFRHILEYIKPYPEISFKDAILHNKTDRIYKDWSNENFYTKFEKILFS